MKEQKGKKPQEQVERFLISPSYSPLFGLTVTSDTDIDDVTKDGAVHQTIKNLVFTTKVKHKFEAKGCQIEENSKLTIKLAEGTRLIWTEDQGYVLPDFEPVTRDEIVTELEYLDGIAGLK